MFFNKQICRAIQQRIQTSVKRLSVFTLVGLCATSSLYAHGDDPNVTLHVNPSLKNCDFDISSDLTLADWKRATREIGNVLYLDPLASSVPLGRLKWNLQLESTAFTIDQTSGAWNNTFHHPDSTHFLTDHSNRLKVPALRFRMGITDRIDVGIYYTSSKPFGANYGFIGVEGRYAFLNNPEKGWAASVRASYLTDANIKDFNISTTGLDLAASKTLFHYFTPYAGAAVNWNHGKITTKEVNYSATNSAGFHGFAGIDFRWKFLSLGYEVQVGDGMSNRSFKMGVIF